MKGNFVRFSFVFPLALALAHCGSHLVDADLMTASDEALLLMGSNVLITMVGGNVVFQKQGFVLASEN